VTPQLKRRQTAEILLLGVLYVGFAFYHDIRIDNDGIPADLDLSALPVTFIEVLFVTWTYHGLTQVQADLHITGQSAKLKMYQTLTRTLIVFVVVFLLHSLVRVHLVPARAQTRFSLNYQPCLFSLLFCAVEAKLVCRGIGTGC